jgi:MFS family permease
MTRPPRIFYGWWMVGMLGVTATVSYGILTYALSVFIVPMEAELGWSRTAITGAFSVGALVAGLAAVPVGTLLDRFGARGVMTVGGAGATLLLLAWSRVDSLAGFYALWTAMGVAMAAVLYEPAFAVIAVWFRARRGRALTLLTFVGGFASVVFVPLAAALVEAHGWRGALVRLAVIQGCVAIPLPALLLRRHPAEMGLAPDGAPAAADAVAPRTPAGGAAGALRSRSFALLSTAFALSAFATTAVSVHMVPLLLERGHTPAFAAAALGALGVMALPGRLVFTPLGDLLSRTGVTAALFLLQAAALAALLGVDGRWGVWAFVALFGVGFGAITPARAALVADLCGTAGYGRISGVLALTSSAARAAAPVGASLLHAAGGGYGPVTVALLVLCIGSGAAIHRVGRHTHAPELAVA